MSVLLWRKLQALGAGGRMLRAVQLLLIRRRRPRGLLDRSGFIYRNTVVITHDTLPHPSSAIELENHRRSMGRRRWRS